jgi:soluble lytic murein transglycosylase-like protein
MTTNPALEMYGQELWARCAAHIVELIMGIKEGSSAANSGAANSGAASFASAIGAAAQRHDVPEDVVRAVVQAESNFNPSAISSAGAKGLMQLMDSTASTLGVDNSLDPSQNIEGGTKYLKQLLDRYHSLPLALAAYNAGPATVDKYGGIPPYQETQRYVERVLSLCGRDWEA